MSTPYLDSILSGQSTFGTKTYEDDRQDFWDNILPGIVKDAYNRSITGMAQSMYTGEQRFNMPDYNPTIAQDFGATALSFLMPADLAVTFVPGAAASRLATRKLLQPGPNSPLNRTSKMLQKRANMDKKVADKVVQDVFKYGAFNSASIGAYDGFYSAAKAGSDEILKQGIDLSELEDKSDVEILKIIGKEGMKGLFKGASLGQISAVARAMRWTGGYGALPLVGKFKDTTAGGFLNEAVAFGAAAPLFDGRLPKGQDFILAGATFAALRTAPAAKKVFTSFGETVRKPIRDRTLSEGPITFDVTLPDGSTIKQTLDTTDKVAEFGAKSITEGAMDELRRTTFNPVLGADYIGLRKQIGEALGNDQVVFFPEGKVPDKVKALLDNDVLEKITKTTKLRATRLVPQQVQNPKGVGTIRAFAEDVTGDVSLGGLNSIRVDDFVRDASGKFTGEIRIRAGSETFFKLDASNTEKFFKHYTSSASVQKQFLRANNKKTVEQLNDTVLVSRAKNTPESDLNIAIANAEVSLYGPNRVMEGARKAGNFPENAVGLDISKLNGAEKAILNKQISAQQRYNDVFEKLSDIDKKNLTLQLDRQGFFSVSKSKDEAISPIGAVLNSLKSGRSQVRTPQAKKLLRYLDVVDGDITVLQGERLTELAEALDLDEMANFRAKLKTTTLKVNQTWNDYIRGVVRDKGQLKKSFYRLEKDLQDEKFYSKVQKKIETTKGPEQAFHQKRLDSINALKGGGQFVSPGRTLARAEELARKLPGVERLGLLPRLYLEARDAGIPVAPYVSNFFPKKMKKDLIDSLFRQEKSIKELIENAEGLGKVAYNNIDSGSLNETQINSLNNVISSYLETLRANLGSKAGNLSKQELLDEAFLRMHNQAKKLLPGASDVDIYNAIRVGAFNRTLKPYASLERRRRTAIEKLEDIDFVDVAEEVVKDAEFRKAAGTALGDISDSLIDTDALVVLSDYIVGASKRQILGGTFGRRGEVLDRLISLIPEDAALSGRLRLGDTPFFSAPQTERQAVQLIRDVITGDISNNASTAADVFRKAANLEMITKINLGFATIPNLTQTAISTAVEAGWWRTIKAVHRLATDREFRKKVTSYTTLQTLVDDMIGVDPGTQTIAAVEARSQGITKQFLSLFHKNNPDRLSTALGVTDKISQFSKVNRMNQMVAGATSQILIEDLRALARGKRGSGGFSFLDAIAPEKRKRYAKNRLQALGFNMDRVLEDGFLASQYGQREVARVMNKFSRDTQLQRSIQKDNILFNHPDFKPFLLFKRFGYRQAQFTKDLIKREWLNGNVMPVLGLGAAGFGGSFFVQPFKEAISGILGGDVKFIDGDLTNGEFATKISKQFNQRNKRVRWVRDGLKGGITGEQWLDGLGSIGAFGMLGDIISSDNKWSTIKFIATPVFFSDFNRALSALETTLAKTETFYPSLYEPFVAGLKRAAPIAGGVATQAVRRLETPKMEIDRLKQRRKETIEAALDSMGVGKPAFDLIDDFNKSIGYIDPSLYIGFDDVSIWKLYERVAKKQKRLEEEYQTLEDKMFEDLL